MSLPHLLLVDDSEAILAFERAALGAHYEYTTAADGVEALEKVSQIMPTAILLDLSMPKMEGDAVLAWLKKDERLASIPVIIISGETTRAEACLKLGAAAFMGKPIQAAQLRLTVQRVLDEAQRQREAGNLAVLPLTAGHVEMAIPLASVERVLPQLATEPLPFGPAYLREMFTLIGQPVAVLDVPRRLGIPHARPVAERMLAVIRHEDRLLALCVDQVRDPEEIDAALLVPRERLGGTEHGLLSEVLVAVARTERGPRAIVDPAAFLSRDLLRRLVALRPAAA